MNAKRKTPLLAAIGGAMLSLFGSSCSTVRSALALDKTEAAPGPIHNPFGAYYSGAPNELGPPMILRTKKGDRSVEVELPRGGEGVTDFVIPVAPAFRESRGSRSPASSGMSYGPSGYEAGGYSVGESPTDDSYREHKPTIADREITQSMPRNPIEDEGKRRDVEQGLGLMPSDDDVPDQDSSYLAGIDHVKQLYRLGRFEAGLIETDELIKRFPTDPKLYEMRGTLLDRVGRADLALKSWNQALRLNPGNAALRKFVDRRQKSRGVAGQ